MSTITPGVDTQGIDRKLLSSVPEQTIRKYKVVPFYGDGNKIIVAMADPANLIAIDDLRIILGHDIEPLYLPEPEIVSLINYFYDSEQRGEVGGTSTGVPSLLNLDQESNQISTVQLVHQILDQAIELGASDIHIEPQETNLKIRYRIDGILKKIIDLPASIDSAVASRIKIMANMDIAEKRLPQDGRIRYCKGERPIDLRVSTMPNVHGEKLAIRILDTASIKRYKLEQLGFSPSNLERFKKCLRSPTGMILLTGPTGSGKTTTLYSLLNEINADDLNISTIEDPVEYRVEGVNQTQVNVKSGMTFALGLRALLRQDPDVILVGEIRDRETAEIAVHAASTGHLVLTTLHTNNALGAIDRLMHMGIESFQVASSVLGVVAQRLVRKLCPHCKEEYSAQDSPLERAFIENTPWKNQAFYRPKGCERCNFIGYSGRMAIQEILLITSRMRTLIVDRASEEEFKEVALEEGLLPLRIDGLAKAQQGMTSLQEIMRVAYSNQD